MKPAVRGRPRNTRPASYHASDQANGPHGINQNNCETVSHIEPQNVKHGYHENPEVIDMCDPGQRFSESPEAVRIEPDEQGYSGGMYLDNISNGFKGHRSNIKVAMLKIVNFRNF